MDMLRTYRRFRERTHLFSSDIYSRWKASRYENLFAQVNYFCLFIGYPRSGHSLVGSLLDAHQNAIIANELDVLKYFEYGLDREQIFYLLLNNSVRHARKGRTQTNYDYNVSGQWQGSYKRLRIIGDKKGGMTTQRLNKNQEMLQYISGVVGIPVKYVHVVRNPFDNITTMALRTDSTLDRELEHYFKLCDINQKIINYLKDDVLTIQHENVILRTEETLKSMLDFLDLEKDEKYVQDCARIVKKEPSKTRYKVEWSKDLVEEVDKNIKKYKFLADYTMDS